MRESYRHQQRNNTISILSRRTVYECVIYLDSVLSSPSTTRCVVRCSEYDLNIYINILMRLCAFQIRFVQLHRACACICVLNHTCFPLFFSQFFTSHSYSTPYSTTTLTFKFEYVHVYRLGLAGFNVCVSPCRDCICIRCVLSRTHTCLVSKPFFIPIRRSGGNLIQRTK